MDFATCIFVRSKERPALRNDFDEPYLAILFAAIRWPISNQISSQASARIQANLGPFHLGHLHRLKPA